MQFPSRGTKLYQLITQNRLQRQKEAEEKKLMQDKVQVKWISGLYAISMEFMEYEILLEVPPPDTNPATTTREDGISIFYDGIDVTHTFVDCKMGKYIHPSASNLSRVMALIAKKEMEDNS